ncbi:MAG: hypothetical protein ACYSX1_02530 [Planctomycetota bacterium]|jgi:hypothetical protein
MSGGSITVGGDLVVPAGTAGTATINLDAGTIDCNAFIHDASYSLDINEGTLTITGDVRADISNDVNAGYITAYNGNGGVKVEYAAGQNKTIVTGVHVKAWNPDPVNGANGVPRDVVLSWSPGEYAASHNVYFGTNSGSVWQRDPSVYKGSQDGNSYDPPGDLDFSQTYYWLIDEINGPNTWPGFVWGFTIHDVYYVDANAAGANNGLSWTDAFKYLQDALAFAHETDHIWVAEGVYKPDANTSSPSGTRDREATFLLKNGVAVYGGFPWGGGDWDDRDPDAYKTILSGDINVPDFNDDNSYHVVTGSGTDETAVLDGFTITAGNADASYPSNRGAGMYNDSGSPTVTNCRFSGNSAVFGGGMYNYHSSPTITNCTFSGNSAMDGGGVHNSVSDATVTNCVFSSNTGYNGGGMLNTSSNSRVTNCTFSNNWAPYGGGMHNHYNSSPTVTDCAFAGNWADYGGGIYNGPDIGPALSKCTFTGNSATEGGAVYNHTATAQLLANCSFRGNWADYGGAVYTNLDANSVLMNCAFSGNWALYGAAVYNYSCGATLIDCTLSGNDANDYGGGLYSDPNTVARLTNCILWANSDSTGINENAQIYGGATVNYSCIQGWSGGGTGNIDKDPNFVVDPNDGGDGWGVGEDDFGDLNLLPGSKCIDAGDNSILPPDIADLDGDDNTGEPTPRDLHGHLRRIDEPNTPDTGNGTGPIVDMGVYEYILRIYVDDNAPNDPSPGNPDVGDPNEDGSRGHPFDAISEGIYAAVDGDTVVALMGTYTDTGNRDIDFSGKAITVRSADPNDPCVVASTIIDANGTPGDLHRGFIFQSGEDANSVLSGLTITMGYHERGGGILCGDSSPTLSNCTITENWAENGGGIFSRDSSPTLTNCLFSQNLADADGGGVYCEFSNPTLTNCTFSENLADRHGGGMFDYNSSPLLTNCTFTENIAGQCAGGLWNSHSSPILNNCTFRSNEAGHDGGGMFNLVGNSPELTNCLFTGNMASNNGGAMYNSQCSPTVTNCTFTANSAIGTAGNRSGGIYNYLSDPVVTNCILWANMDSGGTDESAQINGSGSYAVDYSCVQGWTGGLGGTGNIGSDPLLTPDQHLHSSSPCIDLGDPNGTYTGQTDIDGEDRVANGRVDIGTDEYTDTDADGLPNWWELQYFGSDTGANPYEDTDGDGLTNIEEYEQYGSNPNTPPRYVPQVFSTIQDAIDAAEDGDTVLVAAGTYTGPGNKDLDFGGKLIVVHAPNGPGETIIDCQNWGRGFNFHSSETSAAAVIGFQITNGNTDYGGAIRFDRSHPQIRNCVITANTAASQGGGIYSSMSVPTFADSDIISNGGANIADIWMEYGGAQIVGTVLIADSNWVGNNLTLTGNGKLQVYADVRFNLDESQILCDVVGPATMEVEAGSELVIEGDAIIDLKDPNDPNGRGQIECDGLLRVEDNAQITNADIRVTQASFEDDANIHNNVITVDANAPYGQFFIEPNVTIKYNDIYADGDRYMNLDPSIFDGVMQNNRIFVTITEGVGDTHGGLFELRGDPNVAELNFADPCCDTNTFMCQVDPNAIPDCNLRTWTIEWLKLVDGAKLNLTNRFPFQWPYNFGTDYEVLYVKELILGENSVLNTSFNSVYYEKLTAEPNAVITSIPLLGFSLINIALDDETEFKARVTHNNFEHPEDPNYDRTHVERIEGNEPDPNGMMIMRNIAELDPDSPSHGQVVNARAKGLFSKSSEQEILIIFQYMFDSPGGELVIHLSDKPELLDHDDPLRSQHYLEVGRLRHPPAGRPGAVGSGRFGVFHKTVSTGQLDFIRGTRMELELIGPEGTRILINNWDPGIRCLGTCGDVAGNVLGQVNALDFLAVMSECGNIISDISTMNACPAGCLDGPFSLDWIVTVHDALSIEWREQDNLCPGSSPPAPMAMYSADMVGTEELLTFTDTSLNRCQPSLLVVGKRYDANSKDFMSDRLYGLDQDGNSVGEPTVMESSDRLNGRLIRDYDGELYLLNLDDGLVRLSDGNSIVPSGDCPDVNESRYEQKATVYVGRPGLDSSSSRRPIFDAAFDEDGYVYVVPVLVYKQNEFAYMAAAKLKLEPGNSPPYSVVQLYAKELIPNDNLDPNSLREIEVDNDGNVFVANAYCYNESDALFVYDANSGAQKECLHLVKPNDDANSIYAPIAMHLSDTAGNLYVASSLNKPDANSTLLYAISKEGLLQSPNDSNNIQTITISGMGHITGISEDPESGTLWVVGFTIPEIPTESDVHNEIVLNEVPFYRPYFATVPADSNGPIEAMRLSDYSDPNYSLALPLSIVWTDNRIDSSDFAIFAEHWCHTDCNDPDWCDGADLDESTVVDYNDLGILTRNWLEAGCLE